MHKGPYQRYQRRIVPEEEERAIVRQYWVYGPRKPCGHLRIMLSCRHCIKRAAVEMIVNRQQRSAS
jgi:hypothetical protein